MSADKILVVSYNGFSDTNANGKTLYALLSAYSRETLSQFYRGHEPAGFFFAQNYFHVTDKEMLRSFLLRKPKAVYKGGPETKKEDRLINESTAALSSKLRKHNYNFALRWARELLWCIAPWGRRKLNEWVEEQAPKAIVYMVGESIFEDRLVRKIAQKTGTPIVLYNCEGYRLVDLNQRKGVERLFYQVVENSYRKLQKKASLVIYNCDYLKRRYQKKYTFVENATIAFNAASFDTAGYEPAEKETLSIAYFGNLGVGRVASLLDVADAVHKICPKQRIDVYGRPSSEDAEKLNAHPAIILHGFVNQEKLHQVREGADILLHVESFDPNILPKLKNAFSTKIAQCLCSGRCLLTYAPADMASTEYLLDANCACVACAREEMEKKIKTLMESAQLRKEWADRGLVTARENHDLQKTAERIRAMIGATYEN